MKEQLHKRKFQKSIIRQCHRCLQVSESPKELEKCPKCHKAFLPLNYFEKIQGDQKSKFEDLFADGSELEERELIRGLFVLW